MLCSNNKCIHRIIDIKEKNNKIIINEYKCRVKTENIGVICKCCISCPTSSDNRRLYLPSTTGMIIKFRIPDYRFFLLICKNSILMIRFNNNYVFKYNYRSLNKD